MKGHILVDVVDNRFTIVEVFYEFSFTNKMDILTFGGVCLQKEWSMFFFVLVKDIQVYQLDLRSQMFVFLSVLFVISSHPHQSRGVAQFLLTYFS